MSDRFLRWKARSISLVGLDGSGKSTQVSYLREILQKQNFEVMVIHPFGWKILSFLSRSSIDLSTNGRDGKQGHSGPGLSARVRQLVTWIEVCDIALYVWFNFLLFLFYAFMMKKQVWLVSDRSFDDILVKHMYRKTLTPFVIKTIRRFIPRTGKTIWLQTDPTVAMKRDQEFPESYYRELEDCYFSAAKQFGWEIVPTTQRSPEAVLANMKAILNLPVTHNRIEQPIELSSG